jgi:hypothetical protein
VGVLDQADHSGAGGYDEGQGSKHVHNLMDENSSLRSLNMSLIYEREKLLRELRQCDTEVMSMQRAVDGLLQTGSTPGKGDSNGALCQGFRWLCNKLIRKARTQSSDNQEIPPHLRQVLEACFDKYDEYQRQCQANGDDDDCAGLGLHHHDGFVRLSCLHTSSEIDSTQQQVRDFNELAVSKNGYVTSRPHYTCCLFHRHPPLFFLLVFLWDSLISSSCMLPRIQVSVE